MAAGGKPSLEGFGMGDKISEEMSKQWALDSRPWPWPSSALSQKSYYRTRASGSLLSLVSKLPAPKPAFQRNKNITSEMIQQVKASVTKPEDESPWDRTDTESGLLTSIGDMVHASYVYLDKWQSVPPPYSPSCSNSLESVLDLSLSWSFT